MTERLDYNQIAPSEAKALAGGYGYVMQSGLPSEVGMCTRDLIKKGVKVGKLDLVHSWEEGGRLISAACLAESVTRGPDTGVSESADI